MIVRIIKPKPVRGVKIRWTASLPYNPIQTSVLPQMRILQPRRRKTGNITAAAEAMSSHTRQGYKKGTTSQRYNARAHFGSEEFLFLFAMKKDRGYTEDGGRAYPPLPPLQD
jgi:hypothetical protein